MMDIKEIIKWFIPCFHILLVILRNKDLRLTFICLFLLFNFDVGCAASASNLRLIENNTKNVGLVYDSNLGVNQSDVLDEDLPSREIDQFTDGSVGRTFGRPFKKMMAAMLPLVFQIGAASTWAVVAALVGIKTLFVTLVILKLLLVAGAAKTFIMAERHLAEINGKLKSQSQFPQHNYESPEILATMVRPQYQPPETPSRVRPQYQLPKRSIHPQKVNLSNGGMNKTQEQKVGALFASKGHHHHPHGGGWEPAPHPQKEIHVHIHNGHHGTHEEPDPAYGPWSREDATNTVETKHSAIDPYNNPVDIKQSPIDPYSVIGLGPQTLRTPFGNYMKIESNNQLPIKRK